jgi:hypothetical protein
MFTEINTYPRRFDDEMDRLLSSTVPGGWFAGGVFSLVLGWGS